MKDSNNIIKKMVESRKGNELDFASILFDRPKTKKSLGNTPSNGTHKNVSDLVTWGTGDLFKLISKASSQNEGWMKSTKVMEIPGIGAVIQVSTQQGDHVAEALQFIPNVRVIEKFDDNKKVVARKIVDITLYKNLKECAEGCWYDLKGELLK